MAGTQVKEQSVFREIKGSSTAFFVSEQRGNHTQSMELLSKNGLRPLTYQEALVLAPELIAQLKGKWFYLNGKGNVSDGIYTFNKSGELIELSGKGSIDQKVRVWSGKQPLSLHVDSGDARNYGWRFDLVGYVSPDDVAPVVVGVKTGREATAPVLARAESVAAKLEAAEANGLLAEGTADAVKDLIKAVRQ